MIVEEKIISREFREYVRKPVSDIGLDKTIEKLTPEKIEKVINTVLNLKNNSARFKAPLETCIHCALCSEACHWYQSHGKDPTYAPVAKVRMTLWEMIKRGGKVSPEFIKQCARIAFTECTLCRRCSMYCPYGLDIAYQIGMVRRICFLLGVVPQILMDYDNSLSATLTQLWIPQCDWIDTLQWQEEELRSEIKNPRIPFDKEGADVMYLTLGTEPKVAPHFIATMAKIMNYAGIDWTFSKTDYANMSMFARDIETMQRIVREVYEDALRLKVKRIVATECGHAFHALCYAAPPLLGWKEGPIEAYHATEFYYELLTTGKIKIDKNKRIKEPVTLQDPCNLVRHRGAGEKLRYLVREMCENFVDMYPNREHNFCCNAGGGVIAIGPPWKRVRLEGARVKAEQIKETGAKIVIAP
ncbi:MAG: (Fe-S)-binding protein, partial [Thermodesulfovibrionales bacterium]